ncbi:PREDICTED: DNA damage-inducible transcript 4-like protein [Priapulus caudatus]|uniref:DNA damage-inducible transcript 4-like protein n=1 Tax=Priapulus caudatus TaxID=37621 RepID=A0ABM1EYP4_PRICU|nr:PREDICTED: DNA damage-inducible transcript 4-like protein [Priapulus caudatus]
MSYDSDHPSSAETSLERRFLSSLQELVQKMEEVLFHANVKEGFCPGAVIESETSNVLVDEANSYGEFDDIIDYTICHRLSRRLEKSLKLAKDQLEQSDLQVPMGLTQRIAQDIMRMSENEPCGLRGCAIYVRFSDGPSGAARVVDTVDYDPATVSTHELQLTLRDEDAGTGGAGAALRRALPRCMRGRRTVYVSAGYQLVKRKLYRRNDSLESLDSGGSVAS